MTTIEDARSALWAISPLGMGNDEWVRVGMAWKEAGGDLGEWEDWSRQDGAKFQDGECARRWRSFKDGGGITASTLFGMARKAGWDGVAAQPRTARPKLPEPPDLTPEQQIRTCLEALFFPDEQVCIVTEAAKDSKSGKWRPSGAGKCYRVGDLLDSLAEGTVEDIVGHYNREAGAWFCPNPVNGKGHKNEDVTAHRHALVESDELPIEDQVRTVCGMGIPVSTITLSGGKSAHALVKVESDGPGHFADRVAELYGACDEAGMRVDENNKNPGRLTRLPGVVRGANEQKLVALRIGATTWRGWSRTKGKEKEPTTFNHAEFAKRLMRERHVCFIDGAISVWDENHYSMGRGAVESAMIDMKDNIKDSSRKEVFKYLGIRAKHKEAADKRYIAFKNCVLDVLTMKTFPMAPDMLIANVIPHKWNPDAESHVVDETLLKIANGSADVLENLLEVIGLCMYRGTEFATCPILVGDGSNGKSTYINMLHCILGEDNCSSLDMGTIGERFQTVPLMGKLANLGDDISNEFVSGSKAAVIKKVITGDYISAEYKGAETFAFKPYCTLVFSCNEIPRLGDHTYGMLRRLFPIPFDAKFDRGDSNFNPNIERDLKEEPAIERAIALGIECLRRCIERGGLSANVGTDRMVARIKLDNDSVALFASEECEQGVEGWVIRKLYERYSDFCREAGSDAVGRTTFTTRINGIFNVKSVSQRVEGKMVRVFRARKDG